jgi:hypothetical protein
MRYVDFLCEVGENKNIEMWSGKNKKNWCMGWFHPVEWSKLIKK